MLVHQLLTLSPQLIKKLAEDIAQGLGIRKYLLQFLCTHTNSHTLPIVCCPVQELASAQVHPLCFPQATLFPHFSHLSVWGPPFTHIFPTAAVYTRSAADFSPLPREPPRVFLHTAVLPAAGPRDSQHGEARERRRGVEAADGSGAPGELT